MNFSRISALLSSALFSIGNIPSTLTPMIRPLMEALEYETNPTMVDEIFGNSFALMLAATRERNPCPHPKILKQICAAISSCDNYAPKPSKWTSEKDSLRILSTDTEFAPTMTLVSSKSRNAGVVLSKLCDNFDEHIFEICPSLRQFLDLSASEIVEYLMQMEVCRLVYAKLGCRYSHLNLQPNLEKFSEKFVENLSNPNPAIRFRTSRFLAGLANENMSYFMNGFYDEWHRLLENIGCETARCGAVELLTQFERLDREKIIGVMSLLAPMALRLSVDTILSVRQAAAVVFGKFVSILPLQNVSFFPDTDLIRNPKKNVIFRL